MVSPEGNGSRTPNPGEADSSAVIDSRACHPEIPRRSFPSLEPQRVLGFIEQLNHRVHRVSQSH